MRLLVRSPVMRTAAIFLWLLLLAAWLFPPGPVGRVLDGFVVAGALVYYTRFWHAIWVAIRAVPADAASIYTTGVALLVFSAGVSRVVRWGALLSEGQRLAGPANGSLLMTGLLVIALYLLIIAPPLKDGSIQLSPYAALALLACIGSVLTATLLMLRWFGF